MAGVRGDFTKLVSFLAKVLYASLSMVALLYTVWIWPVMCETIITFSFSRALLAFSDSEVPLNHMFLVIILLLFVSSPSFSLMKFCE